MAAGDFNGDGKLDLAVANLGLTGVSLLLGNGDGTFQAPLSFGVQIGVQNGPDSVTVGDLNGDGKPDLVVPNLASSSVSVLLNTCGK